VAVDAWVRLMGAHSAMTRSFNAHLQARAGMTVTDFEVLRRLSEEEGGRMRRVDLAPVVGLTPSGITRLLDGLEAGGLVCKEHCASDARVTYATITPAGRTALADAAATHLASLEALFGELFTHEETTALVDLLGRLPGARDVAPSCPTAE
jgi:DNA-binding MarR family transcriptional regulator